MKIDLDIKEINLLLSVLSAVDPAGIFCNTLKDRISKQIVSEDISVIKKPEEPVTFGGK